MNIRLITSETSSAPIPAPSPMPMHKRTNSVSPELLSELRNCTPATIPASEKASASELCTRITMLVTMIGRRMIVSTSD